MINTGKSYEIVMPKIEYANLSLIFIDPFCVYDIPKTANTNFSLIFTGQFYVCVIPKTANANFSLIPICENCKKYIID